MSPVREIFLSLGEVNDLIQRLEEKHGVPTADFLLDAELRRGLPEDDVFRWEAFLAHRRELLRAEQELRSGYLERLSQSPEESRAITTAEQKLALAA